MTIRKAEMKDLAEIAAVEASCFPPGEAADEWNLKDRIETFPECFWLLEDAGHLVGFINGMATDSLTITDEMFADASLHKKDGKWQAIFGVDTIPRYRRKGCAARLMEQVIADAEAQGRKGCILTCKDRLLPYYEKFGYKNYGVSESVHGGAVWYDMRLEF